MTGEVDAAAVGLFGALVDLDTFQVLDPVAVLDASVEFDADSCVAAGSVFVVPRTVGHNAGIVDIGEATVARILKPVGVLEVGRTYEWFNVTTCVDVLPVVLVVTIAYSDVVFALAKNASEAVVDVVVPWNRKFKFKFVTFRFDTIVVPFFRVMHQKDKTVAGKLAVAGVTANGVDASTKFEARLFGQEAFIDIETASVVLQFKAFATETVIAAFGVDTGVIVVAFVSLVSTLVDIVAVSAK